MNEPDGTAKLHRTQKAFMNLLVDPKILNNETAGCHVWCWRSLTDKRVCRATLQGEAHGMLSGTEMGDRLRAIICDCKGRLDDIRDWQKIGSQTIRHLWLTDCESLLSHLKPEERANGDCEIEYRHSRIEADAVGEGRRHELG